ncbi:MAG: TonB-dependent receptor [Bacteroidales bacterium]|nr:TonB-dependent receptor [Candidatus Liminaster caballi]
MAQEVLQPDTVLLSAAIAAGQYAEEEDDASDFTFTESQLDEDMDAAQTISSISASNSDPYLSEVGYLWSAMRFRVRALDNMYSNSYLNGLAFNDLETGRFNYSLLGGLNDATRNKEGASAFENNNFGITGIGGGDNTNLRASRFAQGQKITLSACNRNYRYRGMYTYATGLMSNGWAIAGTVGYRGATEGVIEGTFYNSVSYLLSIEKRIGDAHALSLVTFGAPTERAQQGASTEEAYFLAGSHYYNPNWGYQNGKKRNSRVVNDYEPTAILTWDWKIDDSADLVTNLGFKYAMYSSTALGWTGEAYDPRPDYYKNLPSSIFNVYDTDTYLNPKDDKHYIYQPENAFLINAYNNLQERWSTKAGRQVDWDRLYYVNRQNEAQGGEALYYQERRHNDQMVWALSSTLNKALNASNKISAGIQLNHTKGIHYKTMADLLGASTYTDLDKYAAGDYGLQSVQAQSDLRHPNRKIGVDDKFGYEYETTVDYAQLWAQYRFNKGAWNANVAAHLDETLMQRDGKMQNGQGMIEVLNPENTAGLVQYNNRWYADHSFGKSDRKSFLGYGLKAKLAWRPWANQVLSVAGGIQQKAPLVRNAFVAPRVQNSYVQNLKAENILSGEASWQFRFGNLSGKVSGYYVKFDNGVEQTAFFNDAYSAFTYLTMSNVSRQHSGVELALDYQITSALSVHAIGTYGDAKYTNNPYAELATEGMNSTDNVKVNAWENPVTGNNGQLLVAAKDMKEGGTPLSAATFGANYNVSGWFFEVNANFFDRGYLAFSQYRRLTNVMQNYKQAALTDKILGDIRENGGVVFDDKGNIATIVSPKQEKFDAGFMLDASIGKFIRLHHSRSMSINLTLQNLTNNTDMRTGGYEQNRDDNYYATDGSLGNEKAYKFSKNPKYYYANAFNFFLNVNYKF